jgi:hypothetical protein
MRKTETAEELMTRLQSDPDYQKRMSEKQNNREKRTEEFKKAEKPILKDLLDAGYEFSSLDELVNRKILLPDEVVQVLLKWIPRIEDKSVLEMAMRSIAAAEKRSFGGKVLAERFDKAEFTDDEIRWVIANAIEAALPTNITEWIIQTIQTDKHCEGKGLLCAALVKMIPKEKAIPIILSVFDQSPVWAATILRKYGNASHLELLQSKEAIYTEKVSKEKKGTFHYNAVKLALKEIQKTITKIQNI